MGLLSILKKGVFLYKNSQKNTLLKKNVTFLNKYDVTFKKYTFEKNDIFKIHF